MPVHAQDVFIENAIKMVLIIPFNTKYEDHTLKGTATLMIGIFIRKSSINHEFLYKFHQNRLKNGEAMGI